MSDRQHDKRQDWIETNIRIIRDGGRTALDLLQLLQEVERISQRNN